MQLIPSLTTQSSFTPGARDVQVTPGMQVFGGQGGRENEGRLQVDGIGTGAPVNGGGVSGYIADVDQRAGSRLHDVGRSRRSGSRRPDDDHRAEDGRQHDQGDVLRGRRQQRHGQQQLHRRAQAAGLSVPGELLKLWDFSVGVGGPIVKDRLWYFGNIRNEGIHRSVPGHVRQPQRRRSDEADLRSPI